MHRQIRAYGRLFLAACFFMVTGSVLAAPIVIPIELLRNASPDATPDPNAPPERRLAELVSAHFEHWGLSVDNGVLFGDVALEAFQEELASFCAVPLPKEIQTDPATARIGLNPEGQFVIDVDDLRTITISANLPGHLLVDTAARVVWGQAVPFVGNCEKLNTDHGTLSLDLPFELNFSIALHTALDYDPNDIAVVLDKHAVISGEIAYGDGRIESDFGGVSLTDTVISAFEGFLLRAVTEGGQEKFTEQVRNLNLRLDGLDANGDRDPAVAPFNGRTAFRLLDDLDDAATAGALINQLGLGEILIDTLNRRGGELLLQWASVDADARSALLNTIATEAGCEVLTQKFTAPLARQPLYVSNGNQCTQAGSDTTAERFFTDAACTREVAYRPTDDVAFCGARLSRTAKTNLGNAAAWEPVTNQPNDPLPAVPSLPWTTELGTRLNLGVLSVQDLQQPYMKKLVYKTATTAPDQGSCALEIRVYKNDIAATGGPALLALHGGTWRNRGWSFLGLEATVAQLTKRGFIVFAPFYRLADNSDGTSECSNASWQEITADVQDALDWVKTNGKALGAAVGPVSVFGQSAGAHLAAWLAAYRSEDVAQALLFYPPLDFLDFLQGAGVPGGRYEPFSDFGLNALAKLFGARNEQEVKLTALASPLNGVAPTPSAIAAILRDDVFDLTKASLGADAPIYLARCAARTELDLTAIDPAAPPAALLACLKQDLAQFIADNALISRLRDARVPVHIVHGTADELVPYDQAIKFCNTVDGRNIPIEITGDSLLETCGQQGRIHIIANANHALDLGLCAGELCPAGQPGSPTRRAVEDAVRDAYDWLDNTPAISDPPTIEPAPNAPPPQPNPEQPGDSPPATGPGGGSQPEASRSGGGAWELGGLMLLVVFGGLGVLRQQYSSRVRTSR